jgi:hypothetical protein
MIEMNQPETFELVGDAGPLTADPELVRLAEGEFVGELVDTKCFLGVMRPATGKVHRACAVRCLSGGVPPGLLVRDAKGDGVVLLLTGHGGKELDFDVELAGRVVRAHGSLELRGQTPVLKTEGVRLAE